MEFGYGLRRPRLRAGGPTLRRPEFAPQERSQSGSQENERAAAGPRAWEQAASRASRASGSWRLGQRSEMEPFIKSCMILSPPVGHLDSRDAGQLGSMRGRRNRTHQELCVYQTPTTSPAMQLGHGEPLSLSGALAKTTRRIDQYAQFASRGASKLMPLPPLPGPRCRLGSSLQASGRVPDLPTYRLPPPHRPGCTATPSNVQYATRCLSGSITTTKCLGAYDEDDSSKRADPCI